MRHVCAACIPAKIPFFQYDWKKEIWNLVFVLGIFFGAVIATQLFSNPEDIIVSEKLVNDIKQYGITDYSHLIPVDIINWESLITLRGFIMIVIGGFMVGFGTRYGGGCTSGHAIMGLSSLQWPSLVATCCFMIGGIVMANFILPFILSIQF